MDSSASSCLFFSLLSSLFFFILSLLFCFIFSLSSSSCLFSSLHLPSSLVLSCLVLSCLVLSCLVLSCLVLSCLVLSCLVLSCLVLSCLVLSCLVLSCHVMSCHVMSCHVMSCHVMSCHVMSCHVMSCHVMSRRHVSFVLSCLSFSVSPCLSLSLSFFCVRAVWCGTLKNPVCTFRTQQRTTQHARCHRQFCLPKFAHVGCSLDHRGSPKKPLDLTHVQLENRSRTTCSRFLQSFALPDKVVQLQLS